MADDERRAVPLRCRLFGHRYRDPLMNHRVHGFGPSIATPPGKLIGVCERCGNEWRYRP
jgi:hypothetical protein